MQIGELSRKTGCNIETIRYYERIGLLPKPARSGSYRSYAPADVQRLQFVRRARELGFTLDEIRALLALALAPTDSCEPARDLAAAHLKHVRGKIADLRRMERVLSNAVRACDSEIDGGCPIIAALSQ
ncbi:helix-turn-helix domain-containing protein [Sphingomonas sp.]|uniref:MerR family transcriptional regulator n=1 Tax=Sphingomonas sp. TaxID=28214 RepID=UPI0017C9C48A|nr:helix-turn-helix domain-containing protein [Sphingomonas sp.]MBA3511122.1 helix-turn-helix domain-containing protein [Sphingomonas sp.]